MRDDPDTRDLIATAREALKADILPRLEGDAVYAGAMVANALGIALRDLEDAAEAGAEAERDALRRLLGDAAGDLSELNAAFAAAIRAGRFDPGTEAHADARRILWSQSLDRLSRVDPKRLEAERRGGTLPDDGVPWPGSD